MVAWKSGMLTGSLTTVLARSSGVTTVVTVVDGAVVGVVVDAAVVDGEVDAEVLVAAPGVFEALSRVIVDAARKHPH